MFDEMMISGGAIVASAARAGAAIAVRLPWYRSLPLSCITAVSLRLDGDAVEEERLGFRLYGSEHRIGDLAGLHDVFWFVLDEAEVVVDLGASQLGGSHEVELELGLRIPYPEFGTRTFTQVARCSKTLDLEEVLA